jgi:hypothetical protein
MVFALLTNDAGDVTVLSYDWNHKATLKGSVMADLGLFDESRLGMTWEDDAMLAGELMLVQLARIGWTLNNGEEANFHDQFTKLVCPGPGNEGQLTFSAYMTP